MNQNEFRDYLNTDFFSLKEDAYGKRNKLSQPDEGMLLGVCNILKDNAVNKKCDFDKAYANIEQVIENWRGSSTKNVASPYLLRQVLYYVCTLAYRDKVKEYQQTELIKKIRSKWKISQNVWNKWEMYPKKLYRVLFEEQPKRVYPYKGAKTEAVGIGVRHLAFQAGAYADFIDIFGGSGMASASVIHTQGTKYFYNEKNRHVRNLFEVLADDKLYKKYIRAMKDFLYDLRHKVQKKSIFKDVDLNKEGYEEYSKNIKQLKDEEEQVRGYLQKYSISDDDLKILNTRIRDFGNPFNEPCTCYDKEYSFQDITNMINKSGEQDVEKLLVLNEYWRQAPIGITSKEAGLKCGETEEGEKITIEEYLNRLENYYALGYWFYFQKMISTHRETDIDDKVRYAIASTYLFTMAVNGVDTASNSHVLHLCEHRESPTKTYGGDTSTGGVYDSFIGYTKADSEVYKEFEEKVKAFHKAVKGIQIYGEDAIKLVNNYKSILTLRGNGLKKKDTVLFYSDSPYEGTSDYKDDANGVKAFSDEDMRKLIDALIDSKQKFIFSCRASGSTKGSKMVNKQIFDNVFDYFEGKTEPLYVTALLNRIKGDKDNNYSEEELIKIFGDSINKNKGTEIYITNYKVRSFYSDVCNADYLVMGYDKFMEIEKEFLQV